MYLHKYLDVFVTVSNIDDKIIFSKSFITDVELGPKQDPEINFFLDSAYVYMSKVIVNMVKSLMETKETETVIRTKIYYSGLYEKGAALLLLYWKFWQNLLNDNSLHQWKRKFRSQT